MKQVVARASSAWCRKIGHGASPMRSGGLAFALSMVALVVMVVGSCDLPSSSGPDDGDGSAADVVPEGQPYTTRATDSVTTVDVGPDEEPYTTPGPAMNVFLEGDVFKPPGTNYCDIDLTNVDPRQKANTVEWRSQGSEVVFNFGSEIYAVSTDGQHLRLLARAMAAAPFSITADGSWMVYSTCEWVKSENRRTIAQELALIDLDKRAAYPVRLMSSADSVVHYYPAWSPDGQRLALIRGEDPYSNDRHTGGLYVMRRDGSGVRAVADSKPLIGSPRWSPDGRSLAFVSGGGSAQPVLYTVNADGTHRRTLGDTLSGPSWSPDSRRVAFARRDRTGLALYVIGADGTGSRRLATILPYGEPPAWISPVAWSPSGKHLLYPCGGELCVGAMDGTLAALLPRGGGQAAWSPDGSRIVVLISDPDRIRDAGGTVVFSVALDGSDARRLVRRGFGVPIATQASPAEFEGGIAACGGGVVVPNPGQHPELVQDCTALVKLQPALSGGLDLNWDATTPIAQWVGVAVGGTPVRVTGLRLQGVRLGGQSDPIPPELAALTQLLELDLSDSRFKGPIPSELGNLRRLQDLRLGSNALTGSLPGTLGQLADLRRLDLSHNSLTGPIPRELSRLTNLTTLNLQGNQLAESIPHELGQLADLQGLFLSDNGFMGAIPPALGQLTNLVSLHLDGNQLTGSIPPNLGRLAELQALVLSDNRLTNVIPPALGQLMDLANLDLGRNQLSGPIPPELGQLTYLTSLGLDGNRLSASIPAELGQLNRLENLNLYGNELTGSIPPELGQLANLRSLDLAGNQLMGPIPPELGQLIKLRRLFLSANRLTGCTPPAWASLDFDSAWASLDVGTTDLDQLGLSVCQQAA